MNSRVWSVVTVTMIAAVPMLLLALSAAAPDSDPRHSAFRPGELSTYRVSYLGISAGTASITIGAPMQQWGKDAWPIVTVAGTEPALAFFPVHDRFITYWDAGARRTLGSEFFADENHKRRHQQIRIDDLAHTAQVSQQREGHVSEHTEQIALGTEDVAAAIFALRNEPLEVGGVIQMPIFTGEKTFVLKARVENREHLATLFGDREVVRVRMRTEFSGRLESKRDVLAYFTVDDTHILLRIEGEFLLGTVSAVLTEYTPGNVSAGGSGPQSARAP